MTTNNLLRNLRNLPLIKARSRTSRICRSRILEKEIDQSRSRRNQVGSKINIDYTNNQREQLDWNDKTNIVYDDVPTDEELYIYRPYFSTEYTSGNIWKR